MTTFSILPFQDYKADKLDLLPGNDTIGDQFMVPCNSCGSKVILTYRTIKTFCYFCGNPITHLGNSEMYYEIGSPSSDAQE